MMKRNFKNKLAILLATLTLNTLNVPKAASWSAIRTLSKGIIALALDYFISDKVVYFFFSSYVDNKKKTSGRAGRIIRLRLLNLFLEFALSDIVVDEVADRIGNKNVSKEQKKAKNDENPSPADRK